MAGWGGELVFWMHIRRWFFGLPPPPPVLCSLPPLGQIYNNVRKHNKRTYVVEREGIVDVSHAVCVVVPIGAVADAVSCSKEGNGNGQGQ